MELEVAAGVEEGERGSSKRVMHAETGYEGAVVDVVELVGEYQGIFGVVDFEAAVWWVLRELA